MCTSLSSSPKRLLITGATGFIGGHLVEAARSAGMEVWIAIRPESDSSRVRALGVKTVTINYADEEAILDQIEIHALACDPAWHYVIHNAGVTKARYEGEFREVNAEHTRRLCSALKRARVQPERFLLMSSLSSYGVPVGDRPINVSDPQRPHTAYGASKLLAEEYVRQSGLNYSILLPTGVYGPGDKDYFMAIDGIAKGLNFMSGLKPQMLTFVYGADLARAALLVLQEPRALRQSYIVSDGETYTDRTFGDIVQRLLNKKHCLHLRMPLWFIWVICQFGSLWTKLTGNTTPLNRDKYPILAQRSWRCDASPLIALGFEPECKLEEGLRRTIKAARTSGLL